MDQQPATLEQALAAARARGVTAPLFKPQPSWAELESDGRVKCLGWGLMVYLPALAAYWMIVFGGYSVLPQVWLADIAMLLLSYAFMSLNAYFVQAKLNEYELSDSGAWKVCVGALLLNPVFIGGLVSLSVFLRARGIKRTLEARVERKL